MTRQSKWQRTTFIYKRDHQDASKRLSIPSNVTHVMLEDEVTTIDSRSFEGKVSLVEVTLSSPYLETIGESAFEDCMSLRKVGFLPPSSTPMVLIGKNAFFMCESLLEIQLPTRLQIIEEGAFSNCSSLQQVAIPPSVTSIGDCAFAGCTALTNLKLVNGLTHIGNRAFSCCSSLTLVEMPSTIKTIGKSAFELCHKLVEVKLLSALLLECLGELIFAWCQTLTKIWMPFTLKRIGRGAFKGCLGLRQIHLSNTRLETIGDEAFYDTGLRTLAVPSTVQTIGASACQHCYMLGDVQLQEGLKEISNWAFANCRSLRAVFLPSSLVRIGDGAFRDCFNMLGVEVPQNNADAHAVKFGEYVFHRCKGIYSISIQDTIHTDFPATTFAGCPQLMDDGCLMDATKLSFVNQAVYCSRGVTIDEFRRSLGSKCLTPAIPIIDITPFHMLVATPELRHDIFRALLEKYPYSWLSAPILGAGNHTTMMDYLLNYCTTPKAISFLRMVIQATIVERIGHWGLPKSQQAAMQWSVDQLNLENGGGDDPALLRSGTFRLFQQMKRYEEVESMTILELALWKVKTASGGYGGKQKIHQADQRMTTGSNVVIPFVLQYLWNAGAPTPPSISFSESAQEER